jgi:hypothetical protein
VPPSTLTKQRTNPWSTLEICHFKIHVHKNTSSVDIPLLKSVLWYATTTKFDVDELHQPVGSILFVTAIWGTTMSLITLHLIHVCRKKFNCFLPFYVIPNIIIIRTLYRTNPCTTSGVVTYQRLADTNMVQTPIHLVWIIKIYSKFYREEANVRAQVIVYERQWQRWRNHSPNASVVIQIYK